MKEIKCNIGNITIAISITFLVAFAQKITDDILNIYTLKL